MWYSSNDMVYDYLWETVDAFLFIYLFILYFAGLQRGFVADYYMLYICTHTYNILLQLWKDKC